MEKKIKVIRPISELQDTKPKLKVCAYCRVSTEQEDQNGSYEIQKTYYEQYIRSNPDWEFAGIYADRGTGTSTKNRNAFNEMLEDCDDNKIDLIICKSISRFARNTLDTIKIARELKDDGVYIIFEKENINTEKTESELAFNLLASFAQMESESISKNVQQGIRNRFKNGEYSLCRATYGYTKQNKSELIINEKEAEVIRLIFKMYIDGYSGKKIADYLIENNIDCRRKWCGISVRNTIKNKTYTGTMLLQKYVKSEDKKVIFNKGHAPMYELENNHPPIVSKEVFEKANNILNQRKKDRGIDKTIRTPYSIVAGKLICGHCKNTLTKFYDIYMCKEIGCFKAKVTINYIKENFVNLRNDLIENYETLLINNEITETKYDSEYNQQLNELRKQKEIIYRLKEDNIIDSAIFIEKNNKIDVDIINVEQELQKLSFRNVNSERKKLIKYIKKLSVIKKVETTFQDTEFTDLIDKIYVKDEIITYVIKTGVKFEYSNNYETPISLQYGYRRINGKYIIDYHEKEVINYIFNEYVDGKTIMDIINSLKEKGIKTKKGKLVWHKAIISRYLKNKVYLGDDNYPKIIDEKQFQKVQEILNKRNRRVNKT